MNSYQAYQHGTIPNNRIRQNDLRLNYVYNRANQNIDHLKQNYNNSQNDLPIRVTKNVYRNESKEISSILNNDPYQMNNRFSELNSSNNYNSTNYSSFQSNNNSQNNFPNNNEISHHSQYSNFYNRNNNYNYNETNNYPRMPIYSRNAGMNSMNDLNNNNINRMRNSNPNSNGMVNFNGLNLNIGSRINNNNYNNIIKNNSYENQFRRSNYSNRSENINIGNNHYNINLSSVTSQDIYQSFEKQKKENERKKKEEYSNFLKKQIDEKNKKKELEKQKKLKEDMEFEAKYGNEYKNLQQNNLDEKINTINNNNIKNIDDEKIIKKNIVENNLKIEGNELDKNIIETLRKNQYPLINDINELEIVNNRNKKNNYKKSNTDLSNEKISTNSSMIKSGLNIIEGNKSKENFYQRDKISNKDLNIDIDLNNSSKKLDSNKETELYLDRIIQKTSNLTNNYDKPQIDNDQRMKDIYKILENNKIDKYRKKDNYESKNNNFTPDKNNIYKNKIKEKGIQDINLGEINFHSKYENYDNNNYLDNNKSKSKTKSKYNSNMKNDEDDHIKESMKGISEFVTSTSRKKNENISGINLFNNPNNNSKGTAIFTTERKKDKKYILKDDILQKKLNSNKKLDDIEVKDSLNSNMKLTFGLGGDLKFSMANNNPEEYNNKINESISTFNDNKNPEKSIKHYTFGDKFDKVSNDTNIINEQKEEKEEEENIDEEDEEKYDIKVNSENDINYDNMLKSTKKTDLKFLDFDQFCDTEFDKEENKNKKKKKKKKKTTSKKQNSNIDDINENDELCNITISDKEKEKEKNIEENENKNKLTESKKVQMQLNFFSDSITKGISHKRNDKSIFRNNIENNDNDNTNLLSEDGSEENKEKKSEDNKKDLNVNNNNNILEESEDLKDSYGDNILKNINKYRGELQDE